MSDAIKVLHEGIYTSAIESIQLLKDSCDELKESDVKEMLPAIRNYLEKGNYEEKILGYFIDLLLSTFENIDVNNLSVLELTKIVIFYYFS